MMSRMWSRACFAFSSASAMRSEEHTSELQSRSDLVCRLLLEKKKLSNHHAADMSGRQPCTLQAHPHDDSAQSPGGHSRARDVDIAQVETDTAVGAPSHHAATVGSSTVAQRLVLVVLRVRTPA